jgi:hypothetical protein
VPARAACRPRRGVQRPPTPGVRRPDGARPGRRRRAAVQTSAEGADRAAAPRDAATQRSPATSRCRRSSALGPLPSPPPHGLLDDGALDVGRRRRRAGARRGDPPGGGRPVAARRAARVQPVVHRAPLPRAVAQRAAAVRRAPRAPAAGGALPGVRGARRAASPPGAPRRADEPAAPAHTRQGALRRRQRVSRDRARRRGARRGLPRLRPGDARLAGGDGAPVGLRVRRRALRVPDAGVARAHRQADRPVAPPAPPADADPHRAHRRGDARGGPARLARVPGDVRRAARHTGPAVPRGAGGRRPSREHRRGVPALVDRRLAQRGRRRARRGRARTGGAGEGRAGRAAQPVPAADRPDDTIPAIAGGPEAIAEHVRALRDAGVNHLLLRFLGEWHGSTRWISEQSMRLFSERVAPLFAAAAPVPGA